MNELLRRIPAGSFIVLCSDGSGAMYDDAQFPSGDFVKEWDDLDGLAKCLNYCPLTKEKAIRLLGNSCLTLGERLCLQRFIQENA
jgi:hypothetical protein